MVSLLALTTSSRSLSFQLRRTWLLLKTFSDATRPTQSLSKAKTIAHRVTTRIFFSARNFRFKNRTCLRTIRIITILKESKTVRKDASRVIISAKLALSRYAPRPVSKHSDLQLDRPVAYSKTIEVAKITRQAPQLFRLQEKIQKV